MGTVPTASNAENCDTFDEDLAALSATDAALLLRIKDRLDRADERERQARAQGYLDGVTTRLGTPPAGLRHMWCLERDVDGKRFVWHCTCGEAVYQPFGEAAPDELISHPQEHGQMRGEQ